MGLVLKWERKCKAVRNSSHVSEAWPSHYTVNSEYIDERKKEKNVNLHLSDLIELIKVSRNKEKQARVQAKT